VLIMMSRRPPRQARDRALVFFGPCEQLPDTCIVTALEISSLCSSRSISPVPFSHTRMWVAEVYPRSAGHPGITPLAFLHTYGQATSVLPMRPSSFWLRPVRCELAVHIGATDRPRASRDRLSI